MTRERKAAYDKARYLTVRVPYAKAYWKTEKGITLQRNRNFRKQGILNENGQPFTMDDYNRNLLIQGSRCAFKTCNKHQSELKSGLKKFLCVDHDHITKMFRGILCDDCNRNLVGNHTLETALALVEYLKSSSSNF